ncbi:MAG: TetR/AcrR family transcriptional regulator [Bacillota bacterium]|uniref:TetR family transcriptional regulator n=1 Tax=Virgibacillus salarius TaxID=447199 RepID=A0A941E1I8_9BACI|nr:MULTISPECIES: TetR/AcrR family transcriptional regulator [Bacillaceae]MBR7797198.1 TetR family transcriptional regulator [Virgibacillus salarius]MDY7045974.1 TetR/AcrR family transcriptional regulator [Virgibacillus sp. M23]NAZ09907.1 TetR family transcriptional regulator [Agaribacter marinus]WBX81065.1 TetR/AcrR family transcriptional regulator [Virgibacillus salarius]
MNDRQSFIAEARREQIIKAAIEVLEEIGYVSASLSKIAKKANISTGLISYHFSGKEDLMNSTLGYLIQNEFLFIRKRVEQNSKAEERLAAYIDASLDYQLKHLSNNIALIEIVFHARTDEYVPYYLLEEEEGDPITILLKDILQMGQTNNDFAKFSVKTVVTIIRGAISEFMLSNDSKQSTEQYGEELKNMVFKMVK